MKSPRKLSTYLKIIENFNVNEETCFRGQREPWDLLPKIARITPRNNRIDDEQEMIATLRLQLPQFVQSVPVNDWDLLALAQHHGMATRLLDWTFNPIIALWFAVREAPLNSKVPGIVWVFEPEEDDKAKSLHRTSPFSPGRSKLFVPSHVTPRIRTQSGLFSVQKPNPKKGYISFNKNRFTRDKLRKIYIEPGYFSKLRYDLDLCGINYSSMLPDLDGLCNYITWRHTLLDDEKSI